MTELETEVEAAEKRWQRKAEEFSRGSPLAIEVVASDREVEVVAAASKAAAPEIEVEAAEKRWRHQGGKSGSSGPDIQVVALERGLRRWS